MSRSARLGLASHELHHGCVVDHWSDGDGGALSAPVRAAMSSGSQLAHYLSHPKHIVPNVAVKLGASVGLSHNGTVSPFVAHESPLQHWQSSSPQ